MPAFDILQPAQFGAIKFPISRVTVEGGIRDHVHEYPHTSGGSVEKMGRKLYTIKMDAWFHTNTPFYPTAWPEDLNILRFYFDLQMTLPLVIPTIGTIKAYATTWSQTQDMKRRSGESLEVTFREDQSERLLAATLENPTFDYRALDKAATTLQDSADVLPLYEKPDRRSIIQKIEDGINFVFGKIDEGSVQVAMIAARLDRVAHYCDMLDSLLTKPDPMQLQLVEAVHDVWASATKLAKDVSGAGTSNLSWYVTRRVMSVSDVSRAVFAGDGSRGMELMNMNAIEDPFAIQNGTSLQYFKDDKTPDFSATKSPLEPRKLLGVG